MPRLLSLLSLAAALLAAAPAPSARARVGETRAQMDARYGPGKEAGDQVLYGFANASGNFTITAFFDPKTTVTMEIVAHRLESDGTRPDLLPAEIDLLLRGEGGDAPWQKLESADIAKTPTWRSADGKVFARSRPQDQVLIFVSPAQPATLGTAPMILHDGKKDAAGNPH